MKKNEIIFVMILILLLLISCNQVQKEVSSISEPSLKSSIAESSISEEISVEEEINFPESSQSESSIPEELVEEHEDDLIYKEAIYDFDWAMYDNKPYLSKNDSAGGEIGTFTFCDIDFDGEAEILVSTTHSHWITPKTEVFKFDGAKLQSIGGFYGLLNYTGDSYYAGENIDDYFSYYLNENNEIIVLRDIITTGGGKSTITTIINLSTFKNQPLLEKHEVARKIKYIKYTTEEMIYYDELQFSPSIWHEEYEENSIVIKEDEYNSLYQKHYAKLSKDLEKENTMEIYTSINFQMNGIAYDHEKYLKEDMFQDSTGFYCHNNDFFAEQIYKDYINYKHKSMGK